MYHPQNWYVLTDTGTSVSISIRSTFSLNVIDFLRSLGVAFGVVVEAAAAAVTVGVKIVLGLTSSAVVIFLIICGAASVDSER